MKTRFRLSNKFLSIWLCLTFMSAYMPISFLTVAADTGTTPTAYTVSFDSNGGAAIDPITVNYGEKYGRLPSSAVTGLSGGDSNWYLVDENDNVTDTKITKLTTVAVTKDHKLFVKRQVLAPTLKITLEVPGAISDGYQYYVPSNSKRVLTVTVNNQNTEVLDYTYQWYKDGIAVENATEATLTLDGNVSDSGTYTVMVTATLKDGTGIVVTSNTASAQKEQKVKILHAANTLYYDANGGKDGPSSNYTGGTSLAVETDEPTRDGYVFGGWNTKADGTGADYSGGSTYTFAEDNGNGGCSVTLYAKWVAIVYTSIVEKTEGGKATVSSESAAKGETVVITPEPENGKEVDTVTVTDKDGKTVTVTKNSDGTYSFTQPDSEVSIKVTYKDKQTNTTNGDTENNDSKPSGGNDENENGKPSSIPQTGDNSNIALWFALLLINVVTVLANTIYSKKRIK